MFLRRFVSSSPMFRSPRAVDAANMKNDLKQGKKANNSLAQFKEERILDVAFKDNVLDNALNQQGRTWVR